MTLKKTLREAVHTSPDSLLRTIEDVDAQPLDYWVDEIRSSTWVVAEQGEEVVGVAASKHPDPDMDKEDRAESRYIESVWVTPKLRGNRLGERLVKYLMEVEYRKNRFVRQFLLWVFTTNSSAISLYKRLGFVRTREEHKGARTEIKYRLEFSAETHAVSGASMNGDTAALLRNKQQHGITFRVLGEKKPTPGH